MQKNELTYFSTCKNVFESLKFPFSTVKCIEGISTLQYVFNNSFQDLTIFTNSFNIEFNEIQMEIID